MRSVRTPARVSNQSTQAAAQTSVSTCAVSPWSRSASPLPGQSTIRVEMPRAASSWWMPQPTIISLVESSPFHTIMTGVGAPSDEASWKYAGSSASPNGMATFVVRGVVELEGPHQELDASLVLSVAAGVLGALHPLGL